MHKCAIKSYRCGNEKQKHNHHNKVHHVNYTSKAINMQKVKEKQNFIKKAKNQFVVLQKTLHKPSTDATPHT